ncbi:PD-(D/E)XK nuclease family protein [Candidatus Leptofilum sp.]|uniref:PD-(D/E)XK nuclease family protein n=1 Tax=Candidatus Leptofilum sp. TaxID=3241576 RepID=UPI003B590DEA
MTRLPNYFMNNRLTLSQYKLTNFLACQRRFQLRYVRRLPWPANPLPARTEQLLQQGQDFHRLLERHFLGLKISLETIEDGRVRQWWQTFQSHNLVQQLPNNARFLPETGLTVPLGSHLLYGRFDLLVIGEDDAGRPFAHLFDWKTGRPIEAGELKNRWQTRLYLALLAEGGNAFWPQGEQISPEQIRLTYWFVQEPDTPVTIGYSAAAHATNWGELQQMAAQLDEAFAKDAWPLTEDWSHCRECAYQNYCGRQGAGTAIPELDEAEEPDIPNGRLLTPELP